MAPGKTAVSLLLAGLAASFAFSVFPSRTSAHVLTDEAGNPLAAGTEVFATSTNFRMVTGLGIHPACGHVEIIGALTTNNGSTVAVDGLGEDSAVECHRTSPETTEEVFVTPIFEGLHLVTGGGTSSASFTYEVEFPKLGGWTCHFEGTVDVTVVGGRIQAFGPVAGMTGGLCPMSGHFAADFTLSSPLGWVIVD